jgi:hypothetical protein
MFHGIDYFSGTTFASSGDGKRLVSAKRFDVMTQSRRIELTMMSKGVQLRPPSGRSLEWTLYRTA